MLGDRCRRGALLLALTLLAVVGLATPSSAQPSLSLSAQAERVAWLTGPGSINATDVRYQVKATDLGVTWARGAGEVLIAFGDTFGAGWTGPGPAVGDPATLDWRSQTLARSSDRKLSDGMSFDNFVTDRPGHAKQLLPSKKVDNVEISVIPTGGINVDGRDYLSYMSVKHFGAPGHWSTNYGGIAYSDDNGKTWTDAPGARRPNTPAFDNPFQMVALERHGGYVYLFGTPNGRFGDAHLARVPENRLLDRDAYQYWTGPGGWHRGSDTQAVPIVPGPVGELSVRYNEGLRLWTMMYLDESQGAIVLRLAPTPVGPWSPELVTATADRYPQLYGGFIHPWSNGSNIYFTMTQFGPYNVSLMKVRLPPNLVATVRNLPADLGSTARTLPEMVTGPLPGS